MDDEPQPHSQKLVYRWQAALHELVLRWNRRRRALVPAWDQGRWPKLLEASILEILRKERTRTPHDEEPKLMRGACCGDVQQVSRFVVVGVRRFGGLHDHDVIEFEALHLADVRDI